MRNNDTKLIIDSSIQKITENYKNNDLFLAEHRENLPNRSAIIQIISDLKKLLFPGYFCDEIQPPQFSEYFAGNLISKIYTELKKQTVLALSYKKAENKNDCLDEAERICAIFLEKLPDVQNLLVKDVDAAYDGDPAANSKEEVVFSYPGFQAIFVYRIANILYSLKVPFIPRIMTEYAHSETGIDINSGAKIGEYFFIDHGTGVVIGETCVIGNHVKVYQGVTLGALSTRSGQQLSGVRRHPTIEDNVTIYSGASILGGETVIGESSIIGGNCFITESIPANTKVSVKNPELILKRPKTVKSGDWEI